MSQNLSCFQLGNPQRKINETGLRCKQRCPRVDLQSPDLGHIPVPPGTHTLPPALGHQVHAVQIIFPARSPDCACLKCVNDLTSSNLSIVYVRVYIHSFWQKVGILGSGQPPLLMELQEGRFRVFWVLVGFFSQKEGKNTGKQGGFSFIFY